MQKEKRDWFILGMLAGVVLGAAIFAPVAIWGVNRVLGKWQSAAEAKDLQLRAANDMLAKFGDAAQKCTDRLNDFNSRDTVIYDASGSAAPGIKVLGGAVTLSLTGMPAQARPRWVIPGKVTPLLVGPADAVAYGYFDPQTSRMEGPFTPGPGASQP